MMSWFMALSYNTICASPEGAFHTTTFDRLRATPKGPPQTAVKAFRFSGMADQLPFVVSLSNHGPPFDKLRTSGNHMAGRKKPEDPKTAVGYL
jgi:hypothetical protein